MTGILHMETERVLQAAAQLNQTAEGIRQHSAMLLGRVQSLDWTGYDRDEFVARFEHLARGLQTASDDGLQLSQRLNREVEQWLLADSRFGEGGLAGAALGGIAGGSVGWGGAYIGGDDAPPANMQELAWWVMRRDNPQPLEIIKIGENEYLVLIRGTTVDIANQGAGNNWGSAVTTGLGLPGDYQEAVRSQLLANIPPGATLHMAGHSQGGIVGNNLADDQDLRSRFTIGSVTTFGSPASAYEHDSTAYTHYAALGDFVPALGLVSATSLLRQSYIDGQDYGGIFNPHSSYASAGALKDDALPFNISQWSNNWDGKGPHVYDSTASSSLSLVNANLFSGDPLKIGAGVLDAADEMGGALVAGSLNLAVDSTSWFMGEDVRNALDRYADRINRQLLEQPTTSQTLAQGAQMAQQAAGAAAQTAQNAASSAAHTAGELIGSFF